jgi:hypothetical protein
MSRQVEQLFEVSVRTFGRRISLFGRDTDDSLRSKFVLKIQEAIAYKYKSLVVSDTLYWMVLMDPSRYILRLRFTPISQSNIPTLDARSYEVWGPGYVNMYTLEFTKLNMRDMPPTTAEMQPFYLNEEEEEEEDEEDEEDEDEEDEEETGLTPRSLSQETYIPPPEDEETKEEIEREVVDYTGAVFDMLMASETPMGNYLNEDPDNVIIIKELAGNPRQAVGYPRSQLIEQYTNKSALRYKCNDGLAPSILSIYVKDVDFFNPYYRLSAPEPYLIPMTSMRSLIEGTHRFWVMRDSGRDPIERVASHSILLRSDGLNLEGRAANVVSAQHCQRGQTTPVTILMPVDLATIPEPVPEQGGRRRQRNKKVTIRRKKNKKRTAKRRMLLR